MLEDNYIDGSIDFNIRKQANLKVKPNRKQNCKAEVK